MNVKEIKFGFNDQGAERFHTFALGLGPCGRWVTDLKAEVSLAALTITQTSYVEDKTTAQTKCLQKHHHLVAEEAQAVGRQGYTACGWDDVQHMTPTKESWEKHYAENSAELIRLDSLRPEVKMFVYKLGDIRGRIVALQ